MGVGIIVKWRGGWDGVGSEEVSWWGTIRRLSELLFGEWCFDEKTEILK